MGWGAISFIVCYFYLHFKRIHNNRNNEDIEDNRNNEDIEDNRNNEENNNENNRNNEDNNNNNENNRNNVDYHINKVVDNFTCGMKLFMLIYMLGGSAIVYFSLISDIIIDRVPDNNGFCLKPL